jgi:asparagine synthase (glutamine-hydrolysing)
MVTLGMSGIAAFFAYGRRPEPHDRVSLDRASARMHVRGPDGSGSWWTDDGRVGLGHRRLAIIDLSDTGAQPMRNAEGSLAVTFDGEIYNYGELRRELEGKGVRFRTQSDTEVLLHLYAERGVDMVHALRGTYAFALWDGVRRGLVLARDPFGTKPLYVCDDGSSVRVASEVKALVAGGVDRTPEPAGHAGFFLFGYVPEPYTLFRSIRAHPAGSTAWIDASGCASPRVHFDPTRLATDSRVDRHDSTGTQVGSRNAHRAELRGALLDSVRAHLVADVEVGVLLSASVNSTTVAALASEFGAGLRSVTLGFEEQRGTAQDQTAITEAVARAYGCRHTTAWISRDTFDAEFDRLLDRMDQPSTGGITAYFAARAASEAGLKVALSGIGGDDLFAVHPSVSSRIGARLRQWLAPPLGPTASATAGPGRLRHALYLPWELDRELTPDVAREGLRTLGRIEGSGQGRTRVQCLRDIDWAGMSHSLEVRMPLVDWTLWARVAALTARGAAPTRRLFASCPSRPLPDAVLRRSGTDAGRPPWELTLAEQSRAVTDRAGRPVRGLRGWAHLVHEAASVHAGQNEVAGLPRGIDLDRYEPAIGSAVRRAPIALLSAISPPPALPAIDPDALERVLILQLQHLGDSVVFTPALRALRQRLPRARIDVLANRFSAAFYEKCPHIDRMYVDHGPQDRRWRMGQLRPLLERIRDTGYDLVIADVTQHSIRYGLIAFATGCPRRIGFDSAGRGVFFTDRLPIDDRQSVVEANLTVAAAVGAPTTDRRLETYFDDDDRAAVLEMLGATGPGPLMVMHPATNQQSKTWMVERWGLLADALAARYGARVVFIGAPGERAYVDAAMASASVAHTSLVGRTTVAQAAALIAMSDLVVGVDSGPRHLAAATGRPQVTLMSAFDLPGRWHFGVATETILRSSPSCSPCLRTVCPHRLCLSTFSVDQVVAACEARLATAT